MVEAAISSLGVLPSLTGSSTTVKRCGQSWRANQVTIKFQRLCTRNDPDTDRTFAALLREEKREEEACARKET